MQCEDKDAGRIIFILYSRGGPQSILVISAAMGASQPQTPAAPEQGREAPVLISAALDVFDMMAIFRLDIGFYIGIILWALLKSLDGIHVPLVNQ